MPFKMVWKAYFKYKIFANVFINPPKKDYISVIFMTKQDFLLNKIK